MLTVQMRVPVPGLYTDRDNLVYCHGDIPKWGVEVIRDDWEGMHLAMGFDIDCLAVLVRPNDNEDFSKWGNIPVNTIRVEVTIDDVPGHLLELIKQKGHGTREKDAPPAQADYYKLGEQLYFFTVKRVNRFLLYVKTAKGQYWVDEYKYDPLNMSSWFVHVGAKVVCDGVAYPFIPANQVFLDAVVFHSDRNKMICHGDLQKAEAFVKSSQKAPFVAQLLANAEYLATLGHRRNAVTEAVTALETVIYDFAQNVDANRAFSAKYARRMKVDGLLNQVKHLGVSATILYFLPLLLSEEQVSDETFQDCQDANQARQNIIHNSQRDVSPDKTNRYLRSIRQLCQTLEQLQSEASGQGE